MIRLRPYAPLLCLVAGAGCWNSETSDGGAEAPPKPFTVISAVSSVPKGTVEERVKQAEELAARGDHVKAIEKLEEAVMIDDRDRDVRLLLIKYLVEDAQKPIVREPYQGIPHTYRQMSKAYGYLRVLHEYHPDLTDEEKALAREVYYEEARSGAKMMKDEGVFEALRKAAEVGFRDFDRIRTDPDWRQVLANPRTKQEFEKIADEFKAP